MMWKPGPTDWTHWDSYLMGIFSLLKVVRWGSCLKAGGHEKGRFGPGMRGALILGSGVG